MSTQPEALRLADALETADANISLMDDALWVKISPSTLDEAAAELRRLHEVNQELRSILIDFKKAADSLDSSFDADAWMTRVNEAITKFQP